MENREYLSGQKLFTTKPDFKYQVSESPEAISNILTTLKEYREYTHPNSSGWEEYIHDIFHLMGFSTESFNQSNRLIILKDMAKKTSSAALLGICMPYEDSTKIVSWLDWSSLLHLASSTINSEWGIWTNGIEIKIFNFLNENFSSTFFWANLEAIIERNSEDSFFTLYKIFNYLQRRTDNNKAFLEKQRVIVAAINEDRIIKSPVASIQQPKSSNPTKIVTPPSSSNLKSLDNFYYRRSLPPSLLRISEVYKEMTNNKKDFFQACSFVAQKNQISEITVRHDCTGGIKIKVDIFVKLTQEKEKLVSHLKTRFPKCKDDMDNLFQ